MLTRRIAPLYAGLVACGVSLALVVRTDLGLDPWDVFHQDVAERLGWSFGTVVIVMGALVLLLRVPLRQRTGPGTVVHAVSIGPLAHRLLPEVPARAGLPPGPARTPWERTAP